MARILSIVIRVLYNLTAYVLMLELLCSYLKVSQPDSYFTKALLIQATYLSVAFQIIALYFISVIQIGICMAFTPLPFILLSKTLRTRLRYLNQRVPQKTQASESEKPPSIHPFFFVFLLLNGMLFNRAEGSPIVKGAIEQLRGLLLYYGHAYVLLAMPLITVAYFSFCCVSLICKGSPEAGLESGQEKSLPQEKVSELSEDEPTGDLTTIERSLMSACDTLKVFYSIEL